MASLYARRPLVHLGTCADVCLFGTSLPEALGHRTQRQRGCEMMVTLEQLDSGKGVILHPETSETDLNVSKLVLPIAYKEATPTLLADGARDLELLKRPPVSLAVAVLGRCRFHGRSGLLITQRLSRSSIAAQQHENQAEAAGLWNSLWVFPGGRVDEGELLQDAAVREFEEETGLNVDRPSLRMIGLWQAANAKQLKQYLVVLFAGDIVQEADELALKLQRNEVGAAAFLPVEQLAAFTGFWSHGLETGAPLLPSVAELETQFGTLVFDGWRVEGNEHKSCQFSWQSMEGDGGWTAGVGGAHRFALRQYLFVFPRSEGLRNPDSERSRL